MSTLDEDLARFAEQNHRHLTILEAVVTAPSSADRHFQPDWYSCPGETITDILKAKLMSVPELAKLIGRTVNETMDLLAGEATIDEELAARLSRVLGASAAFWLNREAQYRADRERLSRPPASRVALRGWRMWCMNCGLQGKHVFSGPSCKEAALEVVTSIRSDSDPQCLHRQHSHQDTVYGKDIT